MEAMDERRVWQRVRGEGTDPVQRLRDCLARQGVLWNCYRQLSRRGGKYRQLFEQKDNQLACLRGLLRIRTGQGAARPRVSEGRPDLVHCFTEEQRFLKELEQLRRDDDQGCLFEALLDRQKVQCRVLLEVIGMM